MKNVGIPLGLSSPDKRHVNPIEDTTGQSGIVHTAQSLFAISSIRGADTIAQVPHRASRLIKVVCWPLCSALAFYPEYLFFSLARVERARGFSSPSCVLGFRWRKTRKK